MSEIERIARLLEETFEGKPYYGPSVLGALEGVTADVAIRKPRWSAHSIWDLVVHLTAELDYARTVIEGLAGPWVEGETTWPTITDTSRAAWQKAVQDLTKANRVLVHAVRQLDDAVLDEQPIRVRGPFYVMLHGTIQHNVYHAGQISLLTGQRPGAVGLDQQINHEDKVMMEKKRALVSILEDQWTRVWDMWEEMIRTIPDDEWRKGDVDYLVPARHLIHVLSCEDAFTEDIPLDQYDDFKLFEVREWGTPAEELVDRDEALSKLADVRVIVGERLAHLDDAALLEPEKVHPWSGQTRMGKMLYVLRHSQHHLGEVNAELSRRGIKAAIWEKEKAAKLGLSPWW